MVESVDYWVEKAKNAAAISGLKWQDIYAQWYHETGGFDSDVLREYNNAAGMMNDNVTDYIQFNSIDEFVNRFGRYIQLYKEDGLYDATNTDEYAAALKAGGYYTDDVANYQSGMRNALAQLSAYLGTSSFPDAVKQEPATSQITPTTEKQTSWLDKLNPATWFSEIGKFMTRAILFLIGSILFALGFISLNSDKVTEIVMKGDSGSGQ